VLQLRHVFFGGSLLGERPRQHELGLEHRAAGLDHAVQGGRHPLIDRMLDPPLHVFDRMARVALIPAPVQLLGHVAELDDQLIGQILRLDFAALLPPQPHQCNLVIAHDDARVRSADRMAAIHIA
jgi:hypothetical protein